jgi:hypothetical protein
MAAQADGRTMIFGGLWAVSLMAAVAIYGTSEVLRRREQLPPRAVPTA